MKNNILLSLVIAGFITLSLRIIIMMNFVQYIPDDGYYYLTLARHFAESGSWTFDGIHVTTGFHLLWGYILVLCYYIMGPSVDSFVIIGITLSIVIISSWIFLEGKRQSITTMMWLGFIVTSTPFILNSISITEFSLVVLCSYFVFNNKQPFLFSMVGVVARTEFILVPIIIFVVSYYHKRNYELLFGAILGIMIVTFHNFILTGELLQSSAEMKLTWAKYYSREIIVGKSLSLTTGIFFVKSFLWQKIIFIIILILGIFASIIQWRNNKLFIEVIASVAVITIYTLIYCFYGGTQSWYAGIMIIPLFIIGKNLFEEHYLFKIILLTGISFNLYTSYEPPYPHQDLMYRAGTYLSTHKPNGRIGSWNSGIIGYYSGGNVINLDGLVNNSIHPYIKNNTVTTYLKKENIVYVVDFMNMLQDNFPKQGGYNDTTFAVDALMVFDNKQYWWRYLSISRIKR